MMNSSRIVNRRAAPFGASVAFFVTLAGGFSLASCKSEPKGHTNPDTAPPPPEDSPKPLWLADKSRVAVLPPGTSSIPAGTIMGPNSALTKTGFGTNCTFDAIMQGDGNFVIYRGTTPLWWTGTQGNPGAFLAMQTDGNLVVYRKDWYPLWWSNTQGRSGVKLELVGSGQLKIPTDQSNVVWIGGSPVPGCFNQDQPICPIPPPPPPPKNVALPGAILKAGDALVAGGSCNVKAVMQGDGNFVIYRGSTPVWNRPVSGYTPGSFAAFQTDGNFVIYRANNTVSWNAATNGKGGVKLIMQTDSNLVIYNSSNAPIWNSGTWSASCK